MPAEDDSSSAPASELEEKQLCINCQFPNHTTAHFCAKCGAPMTSYAATGPYESVFAEAYTYRKAAEEPRKFIVVFGVCFIFGTFGGGSAILLIVSLCSKYLGWHLLPMLILLFLITLYSTVLIWKSIRNYLHIKRNPPATTTESAA